MQGLYARGDRKGADAEGRKASSGTELLTHVYFSLSRMAALTFRTISDPIKMATSSQSGSSVSVSCSSRSTKASAFQSRAKIEGIGNFSVGSSYGGGLFSSGKRSISME